MATDLIPEEITALREIMASEKSNRAKVYLAGLILSASELLALALHAKAHEEAEVAQITSRAAVDALAAVALYAQGNITLGDLFVADITAGQKLHYYQPERVKARKRGEEPTGTAWWEREDLDDGDD